MDYSQKPGSPEETRALIHYGVKGMKWGVRNAVDTASKTAGNAVAAVEKKTQMQIAGRQQSTGKQIISARRNLTKQSRAYRAEYKQYKKTPMNSERRKTLEASLRKREQDYMKDPDRVIANRMTRGEKLITAYFALGTGGLGAGVSAATIGATSAVSRRIEYRQKTGAYDKMRSGPVKNRIGAQRARRVALMGAGLLPSILRTAGTHATTGILNRAAANRAAASAAARAASTRGLGAAAAKIAAKKGIRGAYKITTMK